MQIFVSKNGEEWGPYTPAQIAEHLKQSVFSQDDLARTANMNEWIPLADISARFVLEEQSDPPHTPEGGYSKEEIAILKELYTLAIFERRSIISFGVLLLIGFVYGICAISNNKDTLAPIIGFVCIVVLFYMGYCFLRFEAALYNWWIAIVLVLLAIIPGVLIIEGIISYFAVKRRYKECGVEKGLLGASTRALQELKSQIDSS